MNISKSLNVFVRNECANYEKYYEKCLFNDFCKVMNGRRCGYLEHAVLGLPDYPYRLPGYDYTKLFAQYAEQTNTKKQTVNQRLCECGSPLIYRRRYCEKCTKIRSRAAARERKRKQRSSASLVVML
ncbi:hypothetical protein ACFLZ8_03185 [Planctomycetota bacterium]